MRAAAFLLRHKYTSLTELFGLSKIGEVSFGLHADPKSHGAGVIGSWGVVSESSRLRQGAGGRPGGGRRGSVPRQRANVAFFQITFSGCRGGEVFDPGQRIAELLSAAHEVGDDPPLVAALVIVVAEVDVVGTEAEHPVDEAGE